MTVTVLRPNSTITSTGVTSTSGTGAIHTDLSDNSDASVTRGNADVGFCYLGLQDITLSAGQRVKQVRVRVHRGRDAADVGAIEEARVRLVKPSTPRWGPANTFRAYYSTQAEEQGPWVTVDPDRQAWTEPTVDALQAEITWYASTGNLFLRIAELYVDVDVNNQPVVTAPTVTGASSTTRPSATTTYTDADGDEQKTIRWKVFSAGQYGASNFSPDTSPATWDSGELGGPSTSVTIGADLVNGIAYRLYVKAAQLWPTPQGPLWYSDWQFTGFTMVLTPPATPTLAVSTVATAPGGRVLADVTAPVNLLTSDNSTFEGGLGQWASLANCTITQSATNPAEGTFAMQMSSTAAGDMTARSGNEPFLGQHVKGGVTYTALASFRTAVSARSCAVGFRWQDGAGTAIGADVYGSNITDGTGGYTQAVATAAAPTNAKSAQVLVKVIATGGAAEIHRVDKVDLHAGSGTVWTPGGMASQSVTLERGERVDDSRGARDNWAHPDVASAGSVRMTAGYGFGIAGGSNDTLGWEFLDKDIAGGGPNGMLHWQPRSASNASLNAGTWPYGGPGSEEWRFPVIVGSTHVFSCWAWVATGSLAVTQRIDWIADDMTTIVSTSSASPVTLTTTPQQLVFSATCPATASGAQGTISNHTSNATADVYTTRFGWGLGTAAVDDKPAAGGPLVWTSVRGLSALNLAGFPTGYDTAQRNVFADWEAPPGRPLLYRARLTGALSGTALSSAYSAYATVLLAAPGRAVLKDPVAPYGAAIANVAKGDQASRSKDAEIVHAFGRDGDPVQVVTWRSGLDTSLAASALSEAEMVRLRNLLDSTNSLLVDWADGGHTYYTVSTWNRTGVVPGSYYTVSIDAVETAAP